MKTSTMNAAATRNAPKVQALSWLVSQLRWEETLGDLRDHGHEGGNAVALEAA